MNLYQELNQQQNLPQIPQQNNLKQFINMFKNSINPQQLLLNYLNTNPIAKNIYSMLQNSNKTPKELFFNMAKERGIDPNQIINMLK